MDIALVFDPASFSFDIALDGPDFATDAGLETAVAISLFSDARAQDGDETPDSGPASLFNRRGWWADRSDPPMRPNAPQGATNPDRTGSRLWLLARSKQVPEVLQRAQQYASEALAWMVEDGVASSVVATASIVRTGVLGLTIQITKPSGGTVAIKYQAAWQSQLGRIA